ncbi:MAG TPA: anthranilate phosphoribosyltransferase [Steroidobacteraceae bacterium]|jgi:anthranilate phosphoribosyltransferase|nr:anthranilate phosphoribosyltransferase [Steroidobacteraceae bacterium]
MPSARQLLEHLVERRDLGESGAAELLHVLTAADLPAASAGALLCALRTKGVTASEVRGLAAAMRALALKPRLPERLDAIDVVGTGGDASGSLNLSTGAALLAAAAGLPVVKHGNRSISSRCGSADLLEGLGLALPLDEQRAADCFAATGFTFLFAPYYHPSMRALGPIRAALGIRTVFNLLGPLTNPASPRFRLIGAYDAATAELMAGTLSGTDVERAWVVHGAAGWDEATPIGPFVGFEVDQAGVRRHEVDPRDLGLTLCEPRELAGGDAASNLRALVAVFERRDRGAHLAALTLQCGLALHIAGRAQSIRAGIERALDTVESGRAAAWLEGLRRFAATPTAVPEAAASPAAAPGEAGPGAATPKAAMPGAGVP